MPLKAVAHGIYSTDDEPVAVATLDPLFTANHPIYISTLTALELFSHASLTAEDAIRLEVFLEAVHILPLTSYIARIAGDLRRARTGLKAFDSCSAQKFYPHDAGRHSASLRQYTRTIIPVAEGYRAHAFRNKGVTRACGDATS